MIEIIITLPLCSLNFVTSVSCHNILAFTLYSTNIYQTSIFIFFVIIFFSCGFSIFSFGKIITLPNIFIFKSIIPLFVWLVSYFWFIGCRFNILRTCGKIYQHLWIILLRFKFWSKIWWCLWNVNLQRFWWAIMSYEFFLLGYWLIFLFFAWSQLPGAIYHWTYNTFLWIFIWWARNRYYLILFIILIIHLIEFYQLISIRFFFIKISIIFNIL